MKYTLKSISFFGMGLMAICLVMCSCENPTSGETDSAAERVESVPEVDKDAEKRAEEMKKQVTSSVEDPYMLIMPDRFNNQLADKDGLDTPESVLELLHSIFNFHVI